MSHLSSVPASPAPTALITGGSTGIGAAFAWQLAAEGKNLVLVARDIDRLKQIASDISTKHNVYVETLSADLSSADGVKTVEDRLTDNLKPIELLINNAGFGLKGGFLENHVDAHAQMVQVNATAVLQLSHAALSVMVPRGHGGIINVASVAAFTPTFRASGTYSATKSFVVTLTEGLAAAFETSGVHISSVCPGFVRSEFHQRAGISTSRLPSWMWLDADFVASQALENHRNGKIVCVPGKQYKALLLVLKLIPRQLFHFFTTKFAKITSSKH